MPKELAPTPHWPVAAQLLASVALVGHFAGVFATPFALPAGRWPAPAVPAAIHGAAHAWLDAVGHEQPWRFFAPEPSAIALLLFRIEDDAGRASWIEYPNIAALKNRPSALQPALGAGLRLERDLGPHPTVRGKLALNDRGAAIAGGWARHLAGGRGHVEIHIVRHYPLTPAQTAAGLDPLDVRGWSACFVGRFDARGAPVAGSEPNAVPVATLAERWLADTRGVGPAPRCLQSPRAVAAREGASPSEFRRRIETAFAEPDPSGGWSR